MMQLASLGSGSKGNATLLKVGNDHYLIDCGFSLSDLETRLNAKGISVAQLAGVFLTHEHGDHIRGLGALAQRYQLPIWATHGTARALKTSAAKVRCFAPNTQLQLGGLVVDTVTVPHDSAEPCQYVFSFNGLSIGVLTDLGSVTKRVTDAFTDCQVLMLECNHDEDMLRDGPYPRKLKRRVSGNYGHLSNRQAAHFLGQINRQRLQSVLLSHISEQNNTPELALGAVKAALAGSDAIAEVVTQETGCDWVHVHNQPLVAEIN